MSLRGTILPCWSVRRQESESLILFPICTSNVGSVSSRRRYNSVYCGRNCNLGCIGATPSCIAITDFCRSAMTSSQVTKSYSARHLGYPTNGGNISRRRSDVDTGDIFKVIEIPFSPFQNDYGDGDDQDFDFAVASRGHGSRQEYLRSYTFSKNQSMYEKMKENLVRLKATAWAVVACNYRLPPRARRMKAKLALNPSQLLFGNQCGRSSNRPLLPQCFRVTAL